MRKTIFFIVSVFLVASIAIFLILRNPVDTPTVTTPSEPSSQTPEPKIVVEQLEIPWDIAFLPEGDLLITERPGRLVHVTASGEKTTLTVPDVYAFGEGGLLGLALHPNFSENSWVYLYLSSGGFGQTTNKIIRYTIKDDELSESKTIIDNIPGAMYHDGGRMEFGPDGYLYITTGDASRSHLAQDKHSLAGKILRIKDDGSIPDDNPFGTAVYSYGHRNPQGLAWDDEGRLWETEHGRSGIRSGLDEINLIKSGSNYGWPLLEGDNTARGLQAPHAHSGTDTTWAPASAAYLNGRLFFGGLKGESLYEAILEEERIVEVKAHFTGMFGRIRTVRVGPDGALYLTTSNRDGRGQPHQSDDRIIRIDPETLN